MRRAVPIPVSSWLFGACGLWLIGLGGYFALLRPTLLPEDPRYIGSTLAEIHAQIPGLAGWLRHVFTVMGGFMAAAGVLTTFVAVAAVPARSPGTGWTLAIAGLLGVALMSATNFSLGSDFRWILLMPPVLWLLGLVAYGARR